MTSGNTVTPEALPSEERIDAIDTGNPDFSRPYKDLKEEAIEKFTRHYLNNLLAHTKGNVSLSAQISGIKRQSLQKIIKRYNVAIERFRS